MIKVVLDTNIIISGLFWLGGHPDQVLSLVKEQKIAIVLSEELFIEIEKKVMQIVSRYNSAQNKADRVLFLLQENAIWTEDLPQNQVLFIDAGTHSIYK